MTTPILDSIRDRDYGCAARTVYAGLGAAVTRRYDRAVCNGCGIARVDVVVFPEDPRPGNDDGPAWSARLYDGEPSCQWCLAAGRTDAWRLWLLYPVKGLHESLLHDLAAGLMTRSEDAGGLLMAPGTPAPVHLEVAA